MSMINARKVFDLVMRDVKRQMRIMGGVVRRGLIEILDENYIAKVEGYTDEMFDDLDYWQDYGFASRPPVGSEALILRPDSTQDAAICAIARNDTAKPKTLSEGEVMLHGPSGGSQQTVLLDDGGNVVIDVPGGTVQCGGNAHPLVRGDSIQSAINTFADDLDELAGGDVSANETAIGVIKTASQALKNATTTAILSQRAECD